MGERVREVAGFVHGDLFAVLHEPSRPEGAVVICGPIGWELAKDYRREVLLGRELARRRVAVMRFHYRGLGESGGSFEDLTVASMLRDAREACDVLRTSTGCDAPAVVGVRLGAVVAARLSAGLGATSLALWDPVVDGREYVRALARVQRIWELAGSPERRRASTRHGDRSLTVLGYRFSERLVAEIESVRLVEELRERARGPVLSLHVGALPEAIAQLADRHPARGGRIEVEAIPGVAEWWLKRRRFEAEEESPLSRRLVDRTARWLAAAPPAACGEKRPAAIASESRATRGRRTAVSVPAERFELSGMLVEPAARRADVAAVVLNCGSHHLTAGPLGLWAELGARLSELGVPSLRVAYHGVAESTGTIHDFDLSRPLVDELHAARAAMRERGYERHVLVGGCLGARTACAASMEGVAALVLVSLPFHVESLANPAPSTAPPAAAPAAEPWADRPSFARRAAGPDVANLNEPLIADLDRCVRARVPIQLVYSAREPYRQHFETLRAGTLAPTVDRAGDRLRVDVVRGDDSMFETSSVVDSVTDFVARLVDERGARRGRIRA
ncbi:MAG TPA: hypothetical protein VHJ34_10690 [Actinomycetota bacterium]|nr:hypothetical protein [Actinomycetota bacterium]